MFALLLMLAHNPRTETDEETAAAAAAVAAVEVGRGKGELDLDAGETPAAPSLADRIARLGLLAKLPATWNYRFNRNHGV